MYFGEKLKKLKYFSWLDKNPHKSYEAETWAAEDFLKIQIPFNSSDELVEKLQLFKTLVPITNGYQLLTNGSTYIQCLPSFEQPEYVSVLTSSKISITIPSHINCYLWVNNSYIEFLIYSSKSKKINMECIDLALKVEEWLEAVGLHPFIDLSLQKRNKINHKT